MNPTRSSKNKAPAWVLSPRILTKTTFGRPIKSPRSPRRLSYKSINDEDCVKLANSFEKDVPVLIGVCGLEINSIEMNSTEINSIKKDGDDSEFDVTSVTSDNDGDEIQESIAGKPNPMGDGEGLRFQRIHHSKSNSRDQRKRTNENKPRVKPSPIEQSPVKLSQKKHYPKKQSPVTQSPVKQSPVTQSPVKQSLVKQSPVTQSPVKQSPVKQSPVKQSPVKQSPAQGSKVKLSQGMQSSLKQSPNKVHLQLNEAFAVYKSILVELDGDDDTIGW
jgi:hypothetical protein